MGQIDRLGVAAGGLGLPLDVDASSCGGSGTGSLVVPQFTVAHLASSLENGCNQGLARWLLVCRRTVRGESDEKPACGTLGTLDVFDGRRGWLLVEPRARGGGARSPGGAGYREHRYDRR